MAATPSWNCCRSTLKSLWLTTWSMPPKVYLLLFASVCTPCSRLDHISEQVNTRRTRGKRDAEPVQDTEWSGIFGTLCHIIRTLTLLPLLLLLQPPLPSCLTRSLPTHASGPLFFPQLIAFCSCFCVFEHVVLNGGDLVRSSLSAASSSCSLVFPPCSYTNQLTDLLHFPRTLPNKLSTDLLSLLAHRIHSSSAEDYRSQLHLLSSGPAGP